MAGGLLLNQLDAFALLLSVAAVVLGGRGVHELAVGDAKATCDALVARGVKVPRPPGPMQHGSTVIAFVEDPDGYRIELIQRP